MLRDVGPGAEEPLLLAGPQRDADRAARLQLEGPEDPHRLHHHRTPRRVVVGAGAGMPGVEVGAQHHDLVRQVRAGNLRHRVVGHQVIVVKLGPDVDLELDLLFFVQQARDPVVVLERHRQRRHADALAGLARAGAAEPQRAAVPGAQVDRGQSLFLDEKLVELRAQLPTLPRALAPLRRRAGQREDAQLLELVLRDALKRGLLRDVQLARLADQEDLARELAGVGLEILRRLDRDLHRRPANGFLRTRRPRLGQRHEGRLVRREHVHRGAGERPAATERPPRLEPRARHPPLAEARPGPAAGGLPLGGSREPGAELVGEHAQRLHDLRTVEALVADPVDRVPVDGLVARRLRRYGEAGNADEEGEKKSA